MPIMSRSSGASALRHRATRCLALVFMIFLSSSVFASSWLQCRFVVTITELSDQSLRFEVNGFLDGDGSVMPDERLCQNSLPAGPVALADIDSGQDLLEPGIQLMARWHSYSAMGPAGAISEQGWQFSRLADQ